MAEKELSVGEVIAELEKPPGESDINREKLLAHLNVLSWFRNSTGRRARDFFAPRSTAPARLTKKELGRWLREGIVSSRLI
jgi:hypothetical protein